MTSTPDLMTSVKVVDTYRSKFWKVRNLWGDTEAAAIRAVNRPGRDVECGYVTWRCLEDKSFLYCTLPSGRRLAYPEPLVLDRKTSWGAIKPTLTYMGVDKFNPKKWTRQNSYGGLLVENVVQAIARDLMAAAALRTEASGVYKPVLTVHDEMLSEAREGAGNPEDYSALMTELPPWAVGCPVDAEAFVTIRYRKG